MTFTVLHPRANGSVWVDAEDLVTGRDVISALSQPYNDQPAFLEARPPSQGYALMMNRTGRLIRGNEMLREAGVQDGDVLQILLEVNCF